jgi:hypothetical protein
MTIEEGLHMKTVLFTVAANEDDVILSQRAATSPRGITLHSSETLDLGDITKTSPKSR